SADVVLYFLNAEGVSLGNEELNTLNKISRRNKNIIVVLNKIDGIEQNDISLLKRYVEKTIEDRYKVIPISAITRENVEELSMKTKSASAYKWIYAASISAGAIGALPVPGSDIAPLTTLQVSLIVKLSLLYDKPITKDATTKIVVSIIAGGLGQTVFRQRVKF